jgi:uncharacterized DUF497 family protein
MQFAFEWDEEKDLSNQRKHGVSFDEASRYSMTPGRLQLSTNGIAIAKIVTSTSEFRLAVD